MKKPRKNSRKGRGKLVIIGGSEDKTEKMEILQEFIRCAGGARARIVVITVATNWVLEAASVYYHAFKRLGVADVKIVDVTKREDAYAKEAVASVETATGIFFTGGDQLHITSLLGGSEVEHALHRRYEEGMTLAGTSAGAAMMSNSMIIEGDSDTNPRFRSVVMGPGMEFILGGVIDTHFSQRGRMGRLLTAVAHYPHDLGIGIDENTAIIVDKTEFRVIGEGAITIIDMGDLTHTNLPYLRKNESLSLFGVKIHILPAGSRFLMDRREPLYDKELGKREKQMPVKKMTFDTLRHPDTQQPVKVEV